MLSVRKLEAELVWGPVLQEAMDEAEEAAARMREDYEYGLMRYRQQVENLRRGKESADRRNLRQALPTAEKATSKPFQQPRPPAFGNLSRGGIETRKLMDSIVSRDANQGMKPTAFRKARRGPKFSEYLRNIRDEDDSFVALRQDFAPEVDDHLDDATFLTHQDWEQRIAEAASRRKEQTQAVQPDEAHSTGIIGTLKGWATGLWKKVKETLWG